MLSFLSPLRSSHPFTAPQRDAVRVRIRHSEIGELAHQAESARIFAKGEIPVFFFPYGNRRGAVVNDDLNGRQSRDWDEAKNATVWHFCARSHENKELKERVMP